MDERSSGDDPGADTIRGGAVMKRQRRRGCMERCSRDDAGEGQEVEPRRSPPRSADRWGQAHRSLTSLMARLQNTRHHLQGAPQDDRPRSGRSARPLSGACRCCAAPSFGRSRRRHYCSPIPRDRKSRPVGDNTPEQIGATCGDEPRGQPPCDTDACAVRDWQPFQERADHPDPREQQKAHHAESTYRIREAATQRDTQEVSRPWVCLEIQEIGHHQDLKLEPERYQPVPTNRSDEVRHLTPRVPAQHSGSPAGRASTTGLRRNAKATPPRPVWCNPLLDGSVIVGSPPRPLSLDFSGRSAAPSKQT